MKNDTNLLSTLFQVECFDEISILLYRMPGVWSLNKEQFILTINKNQLDLTLYFLKIRSCVIVLDDFKIQKLIVDNYIK